MYHCTCEFVKIVIVARVQWCWEHMGYVGTFDVAHFIVLYYTYMSIASPIGQSIASILATDVL